MLTYSLLELSNANFILKGFGVITIFGFAAAEILTFKFLQLSSKTEHSSFALVKN